MSRKIYLLLLPILFAAVVVTFLSPIERFVVRRYLLTHVEGMDSFQDGVLVISKPFLKTTSDLISVSAEELRVTYDLSFWQRYLHLSLEWVQPRIVLAKTASASQYGSALDYWGAWLPTDVDVKVIGGQVFWKGDERALPLAILEGHLSTDGWVPKGKISLAMSGSEDRGMQMIVGESSPISIKLQSMPGELLTALARSLSDLQLPFEADQGTLSGHLELIQSYEGFRPRGHITVDHVAGRLTSIPLLMRIKEGRLIFTASQASKDDTVVHVQGDITLADVEPLVLKQQTWKIQGFKGQMMLAARGATSLSCRGQWWHDGVVKALRFDAKGISDSVFRGALSFVDVDGNEGRIDLQQSPQGAVKGTISHLEAAEIIFFRQLFKKKLPTSGAWNLVHGTIDGAFTVNDDDFVLENMSARNVSLRRLHDSLGLSADLVQGAISFSGGEVSSLDVGIVDADIKLHSVQGPLELSRSIQGKLKYEPQSLSASLQGNFLSGDGHWSLDREDGWRLRLVTPGQHLTSLLPESLIPSLDDHEIVFSANIADGGDPLRCQGTIALNGGVSPSKEAISFSLQPTVTCLDALWGWLQNKNALTVPLGAELNVDSAHDVNDGHMSAWIEYQDGKVVLKNLEASIDGLTASGEASLQVEDTLHGRLEIKSFSSTIGQLGSYLKYFDRGEGLLHKLPMEGVLTLDDAGSLYTFHASPSGLVTEGVIRGEVRDGVLTVGVPDLSLREMSMRFAYAFPSNTLAVSDLQGTLLVGRPGKTVEEYRLYSDSILVTEYPEQHVNFDFWIGDKVRDIIRVSGEAIAKLGNADHTAVDFFFDKDKTHFGNVHPQVLELSLRDWEQVTKAELAIQFDLNTLLHDLQRLSRAGMPLLSQRMLDELQALNRAKGLFFFSTRYDREVPIFTYDIRGRDVAFDDHAFYEFLLLGNIQGDNWVVDQLKMDDLSFAADLQRQPDSWKINFLGMRCANALTLGLEGDYFVDRGLLQGRINLLELSLSNFKHWEMTRRFAQNHSPRGDIRSNGTIEINVLPAPAWAHVTAHLDTSFRFLELDGVRLRDGQHIVTSFDSKKGIALDDVKTAILPSRVNERPVDLEAAKITYDINLGEWAVERGRFFAPNGSMGWLVGLFKNPLGPSEYQVVRQMADKVISQQGINGEFALRVARDDFRMKIAMDGGTYLYGGHPYVFKDIAANYNPYELKVSGQMSYRDKPIWMAFRSQRPLSPHGQLIFSESSTKDGAYEPLVLSWAYLSESGLGIQRIEGKLFGVEADLAADKVGSSLRGVVRVDVDQLSPVMPKELFSGLQSLDIKGRYLLDGSWYLNGLSVDSIYFKGRAQADRWEVAGYRLDALSADVEYQSGQLQLKDVAIQDAAGKMEIPQILLNRSQQHTWLVSIPEVTATELAPDALRKVEGTSRRRPGLSFPKASLTALSGNLSDPQSFKGEGSARFVHSNRRKGGKEGLRDIMSKIGLDLDLITPTSGVIEYQIRDGSIVITKLKDVYSQGKLAKFVLPKDGKPSTIDFEGNLDLAIKVRPTQPLLKIADKVTLNIQGTVKKPIVTID